MKKLLLFVMILLILVPTVEAQRYVYMPRANNYWWEGPSQQAADFLWEVNRMQMAREYQQEYVPTPPPPSQPRFPDGILFIDPVHPEKAYRLYQRDGYIQAIPVFTGK